MWAAGTALPRASTSRRRNAARTSMVSAKLAPRVSVYMVVEGHPQGSLAALQIPVHATDNSFLTWASVARRVSSAAQVLANAAQLTPCVAGLRLPLVVWESAVLPIALAAALQVPLNAAPKERNVSLTRSTHSPRTLQSVFHLCQLS